MDWLANITLPYIITAVVVLFIARLVLGKYKSAAAKQATEFVESALIAVVLVFLIIRPFIVQAFYIPSGSMEPTLLGHDYPTRVHDHILVNKFIYRFQEPRHGDIVVFKSPPGVSADGVERDFIKRVVGLPNDVIRVTPGYVVMDGKKLSRQDLKQLIVQDDSTGNGDDSIKLSEDGASVYGRFYDRRELARKLGAANAGALKIVPGRILRNGKPLDESYTREDPDYDMKPVKIPKGRLFVMGDNRNNSNDSHAWGTLDRNRVIGKSLVRFWPLTRIGIPR